MKSPQEVLDEVRLAIGANDGEPLLDAIHRYTFAVQLAFTSSGPRTSAP